ncbi:MAG: hypothetical protein ABR592_04190 [Nitriliruptorales bacterium]
MTLTRRILTLGATALAAVAIATPALAHQDPNNATTNDEHNHAVTYCRDSTQHPGEGDVITTSEKPSGNWHECQSGEAAGYEAARKQRYEAEAAAREQESQRRQQVIAREQAEADTLEEQAKLCTKQPSLAACSPYTSSVPQSKPAPPKPVSYHRETQQEKASRYGNPAGVEVRPVADRPEDEGLEDAVDVPDTDGFALIDRALRPGPRNLVWFSAVAMAAIASLGYGLWRILFVGDV